MHQAKRTNVVLSLTHQAYVLHLKHWAIKKHDVLIFKLGLQETKCVACENYGNKKALYDNLEGTGN